MSPFRLRSVPFLVLGLLASPAGGEIRLEVSGSARADGAELEVRVRLANSGDAPAARLAVEGELLGNYDTARLEEGVTAGGSASVALRFPLDVPRPGVHLLALHLQYPGPGGTAAPWVSQRAYLLLALGANPQPAVRLFVEEARVETRGLLTVGLESADGAPHRVRLRVLTPRGLNARDPEGEVSVPGAGRVAAQVELLRGGAPRPSRQGILVVAGATDGPEERTTVVTGVVEVLPDPAWLPRLRRPLVLLAFSLLAAALALELWRRRPPPRE